MASVCGSSLIILRIEPVIQIRPWVAQIAAVWPVNSVPGTTSLIRSTMLVLGFNRSTRQPADVPSGISTHSDP
jgi:hypothetical protein